MIVGCIKWSRIYIENYNDHWGVTLRLKRQNWLEGAVVCLKKLRLGTEFREE